VRTGINPRKAIAAVLLALISFSCLPAVRGFSRATPIPQLPTILSAIALPVSADLDGDYATDNVNLRSDGFDKTVDIEFANLHTRRFTFASKSLDKGKLIATDIDGDGDVDLIWVAGREQKTVVVLINNGKGELTQAKDNSPYAGELKEILSNSEPSDQHSLQSGETNVSLTSSSFLDIGLPTPHRFICTTIQIKPLTGLNIPGERPAFLSYLHKRGPPLIFS